MNIASALLILAALGPDDEVRLSVARDTWFSNVGSEADANLGGAGKLKLKSIQEMSLVDVDPAPLRGRVVVGATLHLRNAAEPPLRRVTVGTFGADWVEGTSPSYAPQAGSSTFRHKRHPDIPWAYPGSDLCAVILGQGGTAWANADATAPDKDGWQTIRVEPSIVAARVAGVSGGFFLFDDTGTEWARDGDKFTSLHFPNRFAHSRDSRRDSAPYLVVKLGAVDRDPPPPPADIRADPADLPAGEAWVGWTGPRDVGAAGVAGFVVKVDGKEVPRYLVPAPSGVGKRVRMHLRDLDLKPNAEVMLAVVAVDGAGNVGKPATARVKVSGRGPITLPSLPIITSTGGALPRLGGAEVAVLDELDKVRPVGGELIPARPPAYLAGNHLWSAGSKTVRLQAARNEHVAFQVLLKGAVKGVRPSLRFDPPIEVQFGRYRHVPTPSGPLPDPIEPLIGPMDLPDAAEAVDGQRNASLHVELYVPHDAPAGGRTGRLELKAGGETLSINIILTTWDFTLPDQLSFLPDMNCYGLGPDERDYYRLAHRHRTVLNRVPYSHNGKVHEGFAPTWDGKKLGWEAWDRRFGPYFDGSAFADLPRRGVPMECFYLPLFENWPSPMEGNYNGDYWADRAFTAAYRRDFAAVTRRMAEHFEAKGWRETFFQGFFNGKADFKRGGWSRGTCPWLLDEPANFQDFWALREYALLFKRGVDESKSRAKMIFRADISRPQWQRDTLDGLLGYNVVGSAMRPYNRVVMDRKAEQGGLVVEYGTANALDEPNIQPVAWSLDTWSLGGDGVLPWQTVGNDKSWRSADPLSLFYPARDGKPGAPVPSIRLKAFRRGQQDVEYLTMLATQRQAPRWAVGGPVREALRLDARRAGAGEDAGVLSYDKVRADDLWRLRAGVGAALSAAHPKASRRLVDMPPRPSAPMP